MNLINEQKRECRYTPNPPWIFRPLPLCSILCSCLLPSGLIFLFKFSLFSSSFLLCYFYFSTPLFLLFFSPLLSSLSTLLSYLLLSYSSSRLNREDFDIALSPEKITSVFQLLATACCELMSISTKLKNMQNSSGNGGTKTLIYCMILWSE